MSSSSSPVIMDEKESSLVNTDDELKVSFIPMPETQTESFKRVFTGYKDGLHKSVPGGLVMNPNYAANAEKIYGIKPRKDDIWLLTFPKTGRNINI